MKIERRTIAVDSTSPVYEYTLSNGNSETSSNMSIKVLSYGATLQSVMAPDRLGNLEEVALCYQSFEDLKTKLGPYFGCIAGRYANRIAHGKFHIDGEQFTLPINNGPNSLHGGSHGFDKKVWKSSVLMDDESVGVQFEYTSPDGEEGYPGTLQTAVTYRLSVGGEIIIDYEATTSAPTAINLTNHTYWNLSGNMKRKIPIGEIKSVEGTLFDFRIAKNPSGVLLRDVVADIDGCGRPGLDHCFVVDGALESVTIEQSKEMLTDNAKASFSAPLTLRHVATLTDEMSGRRMQVRASQPGLFIHLSAYLLRILSAANSLFQNPPI